MADDVVFDDTQIGRGFRPLAQYGQAVVTAAGTLRLFDSDGDLIVEAPLGSIRAWIVRVTFDQTVAVVVDNTKYYVSPGWGVRRVGGLWKIRAMRADVRRLIGLLRAGGATTAGRGR